MAKNVLEINIEKIFSTACELPYCKIDREEFLTKELKSRISLSQLDDALANGTVNAKIPVNMLDDIAKGAIALESTKVTLISAAAGLPGGFTMIGTVPADLAQFYAHVFRIAQKLAYIYGSKDLDLNDGAQSVLMVYLGAMFGVCAANAVLVKFAAEHAAQIGVRVAAKPLGKYAIYNITKKILAWIGVKLTKDAFGKAIAKAIPVIGGILSGGFSLAMYLPMADKLQKELSELAAMSQENLAKASAEADIILSEEEY